MFNDEYYEEDLPPDLQLKDCLFFEEFEMVEFDSYGDEDTEFFDDYGY